ncbi:TPA: hypothetical protein ACKLW3_000876 [Neisseria gonorrhoeae]
MLFKTRPFEARVLNAPSGVPEGGRLYGLAGWMGALFGRVRSGGRSEGRAVQPAESRAADEAVSRRIIGACFISIP